MSSPVSAANAFLLLQELKILLKAPAHGREHQSIDQKFADIAQEEIGIPFVLPLVFRIAPSSKVKRDSRKGRSARDQNEDADKARTGRGPPKRNPDAVDVSV